GAQLNELRFGFGEDLRHLAGLGFVGDAVHVQVGAGAGHDVEGVVYAVVVEVGVGVGQLDEVRIEGAGAGGGDGCRREWGADVVNDALIGRGGACGADAEGPRGGDIAATGDAHCKHARVAAAVDRERDDAAVGAGTVDAGGEGGGQSVGAAAGGQAGHVGVAKIETAWRPDRPGPWSVVSGALYLEQSAGEWPRRRRTSRERRIWPLHPDDTP